MSAISKFVNVLALAGHGRIHFELQHGRNGQAFSENLVGELRRLGVVHEA
jgi:hypothetical protein